MAETRAAQAGERLQRRERLCSLRRPLFVEPSRPGRASGERACCTLAPRPPMRSPPRSPRAYLRRGGIGRLSCPGRTRRPTPSPADGEWRGGIGEREGGGAAEPSQALLLGRADVGDLISSRLRETEIVFNPGRLVRGHPRLRRGGTLCKSRSLQRSADCNVEARAVPRRVCPD